MLLSKDFLRYYYDHNLLQTMTWPEALLNSRPDIIVIGRSWKYDGLVSIAEQVYFTDLNCKNKPLGAAWAAACNSCDFPNPGSPTTKIWGLDLDPFSYSVPPSKPSTRPALTASWPNIEGHRECTSNLNTSSEAWISCNYT